MFDKYFWEATKRHAVDHRTCIFFHRSNGSFDLGNVSICCHNVEVYWQDIISDTLKLMTLSAWMERSSKPRCTGRSKITSYKFLEIDSQAPTTAAILFSIIRRVPIQIFRAVDGFMIGLLLASNMESGHGHLGLKTLKYSSGTQYLQSI